MKHKLIALSLLLIGVLLAACSPPVKALTTVAQPQSLTITERLAVLETQRANDQKTIAQLKAQIDSMGGGNYKFTVTKTGAHVVLPPGVGAVSFRLYFVPNAPINEGKVGDSYENALKAMYSSPPITRSFTPTLVYTNNQWQLVEFSFSTGSVALKTTQSEMDLAYTVLTPCATFFSVLNVAGGGT